MCFPLCGLALVKRIDTMVLGTLVKYTNDSGTELERPYIGEFGKEIPSSEFQSNIADKSVLIEKIKKIPQGAHVLLTLKNSRQLEKIFIKYNAELNTVVLKDVGGSSAIIGSEYFLQDIGNIVMIEHYLPETREKSSFQ